MPELSTTKRAEQDLKEGKSPSTAAGEFVHEEIEHVREGKHGARSPQQAIAIGLSKARRAGIPLKPPARGKTKEATRKNAERAYRKGQSGEREPSPRASRSRKEALEREPHSTVSRRSLSAQSHRASQRRSSTSRHRAAQKAVQTKGETGLRRAAKKAARTRAKSR